MISTYENLVEIADLCREINERILVDLYRTEYQEKQMVILAKLFCDNFGHIKNLSDKYYSIDEDDKASMALMAWHKALMNFDIMFNASLLTFFSSIYKSKLDIEIQKQQYQKRRINYECENIECYMQDDSMEDNYINNFEITAENSIYNSTYITNRLEKIELEDYIDKNSNLTRLQKDICNAIINIKGVMQKGLQKDVADMLEISPQCVSAQMKKIRNKKVFYNFS